MADKKDKTKKDKVASEPIGKVLSPRQIKFCEYYTGADKEMFGNGVESYLEVYDVDTSKPNWYKTACAAASRLLSNVKVYTKISELLELGGFNDQNVEKQHLFLINQFTDLKTKRAALFDYYKLKGKFVERLKIVDDEGNSIFKEQTELLRNLSVKKDDNKSSEGIS